MTEKEELKQRLEDAKLKLEEKGFYLGEEGELMDLFPAMKQYGFAFQDAIEEVWPDKAWWQLTNYWDIFQDSIMSGKKADEVIQDILDHIEVDETIYMPDFEYEYDFEDIDDEEHITTDREEVLTDKEKPNYIKEESLNEDVDVTDSVMELFDKGE